MIPANSAKKLSHLDSEGNAAMVDVSGKVVSFREATAEGRIQLRRETLEQIQENRISKGNVLATARLAGIMAAKRTGDLIPLCHPLPLTHCEVNFDIPGSHDCILIRSTARVTSQTGVEMEALTAVALAALTIYDMCKAVDDSMSIGPIRLVSKNKSPAGASNA
jgi:cyclic pyranopterin phosphate synthase